MDCIVDAFYGFCVGAFGRDVWYNNEVAGVAGSFQVDELLVVQDKPFLRFRSDGYARVRKPTWPVAPVIRMVLLVIM
jgi:hypothetical protein